MKNRFILKKLQIQFILLLIFSLLFSFIGINVRAETGQSVWKVLSANYTTSDSEESGVTNIISDGNGGGICCLG